MIQALMGYIKKTTLLIFIVGILPLMTYAQQTTYVIPTTITSLSTDSLKIIALNQMAWDNKSNEPEKAIFYAQKALDLSLSQAWEKGIADSYHTIGMVHWYKSEFDIAAENFFLALNIRERIDDKLGLSRSYNNIGNVFFKQEEYNQALEYYKKALNIRKETKDSTGLIYSYNNMGDILRIQEKHEDAYLMYSRAVAIAKAIDHKAGLAFVLINLGDSQVATNNIRGAKESYTTAMNVAMKIQDKNRMAMCMNKLAAIYIDENDPEKALDLAHQSDQLSRKINATDRRVESCRLKASAYSKLKEYDKAYLALQDYTRLHNEILGKERQKAIISMKAKYESAKKEAELLAQKTELQEQEDKVSQLNSILLALGIFVLGIFFVGFYIRYMDQKRTSAILTEKNKQIEAQNQNLVRSNMALEQFAYVASHDLKEPLRNINTFASLFKKQYKDKIGEDGKDYLNIITRGVSHMSSLLEDILAYSRLTQNANAQIEDVDMNNVVKSVQQTLGSVIEERKVEIETDVLPTIKSNTFQMYQLFQNLVSNGIKFNDNEAPEIKIGYERENGHHHFSVSDNGIGINKEFERKIFQVFQRLHKNQYQGTGVGLAICKKIVQQHNGEIWLDSEEGKGATFHFTIQA